MDTPRAGRRPSSPPAGARRPAPAVATTVEPSVRVLDYHPPFDWASMIAFLQARAIPGVEWCDAGAYYRTFAHGGRPGVLSVANDASGQALVARIWIEGVVPWPSLVARLRSMFDLHVDPAAIHATLGGDRRLGPFVQAAPGLRVPGCWDPFELAVRAMLGQQVTVAAARTLATRLVERWGSCPAWPFDAATPGRRLFPTADALAAADIAAIGMPGRRAATIRSLAAAVAAGRLRLDPAADWATLRAALLDLPGIGEWTVGYVQLRAMKDPDAFPRGDIALLRAAQRLGIAPTQAALQRAAEAWQPWRSYAVLHLWRSLSQAA